MAKFSLYAAAPISPNLNDIERRLLAVSEIVQSSLRNVKNIPHSSLDGELTPPQISKKNCKNSTFFTYCGGPYRPKLIATGFQL